MAFGFSQAPVDQDAADASAYANLPTAMRAGGANSVVTPAVVAAAQAPAAPPADPAPQADPAAAAPPPPPAPAAPAASAPTPAPLGPAAAFLHRVLGIPDEGAALAPASPPAGPQGPGAVTPLPLDAKGNPLLTRKPIGLLEGLGDALLGGLPTAISNANYQRSLAPLRLQQFLNAQRVVEANAGSLTPGQLAAARADPLGFQAQVEAGFAPAILKPGEARSGAGLDVYNPVTGIDNGRSYSIGRDGSLATAGANTGPKISLAPNGGLIDERGIAAPNGVAGSMNIPQKMAPGEVPNTFNAGASGASTPSSSASPANPSSMWGASSSPRSLRNMNPGNLTQLPAGQKWAGQTGVDPQGYVRFATPQDGEAAAMKNIGAYAQRGINTVARAIGRWAPQAAGNNTGRYASFVARQMGVGPQDKIDLSDPATAGKFYQAVAAYEAGPEKWAQAQSGQGGAPTAAGIVSTAPAAGPAASAAPGWSGPAAKTVVQNPDRTQTEPDGKTSPAPGFVGPDFVQSARKDFYGSDDYKEAVQATNALNSLTDALKTAAGPNGIIGSSAINNLGRAETGRSMTTGAFKNLMGEIGLPQEVEGKISALIDKGGYSQETVQNAYSMLTKYANTKVAQAKLRMQNEEDNARQLSGGRLGLNLTLGDAPRVIDPKQWYQGQGNGAGGNQGGQPTLQQLLAEKARRSGGAH